MHEMPDGIQFFPFRILCFSFETCALTQAHPRAVPASNVLTTHTHTHRPTHSKGLESNKLSVYVESIVATSRGNFLVPTPGRRSFEGNVPIFTKSTVFCLSRSYYSMGQLKDYLKEPPAGRERN